MAFGRRCMRSCILIKDKISLGDSKKSRDKLK